MSKICYSNSSDEKIVIDRRLCSVKILKGLRRGSHHFQVVFKKFQFRFRSSQSYFLFLKKNSTEINHQRCLLLPSHRKRRVTLHLALFRFLALLSFQRACFINHYCEYVFISLAHHSGQRLSLQKVKCINKKNGSNKDIKHRSVIHSSRNTLFVLFIGDESCEQIRVSRSPLAFYFFSTQSIILTNEIKFHFECVKQIIFSLASNISIVKWNKKTEKEKSTIHMKTNLVVITKPTMHYLAISFDWMRLQWNRRKSLLRPSP